MSKFPWPVGVLVCVEGVPCSTPGHRRPAVTYAPGQRHPPCETGRVLRGLGADWLSGSVAS